VDKPEALRQIEAGKGVLRRKEALMREHGRTIGIIRGHGAS
jgi:hypothetical protein